MHLHISIHVPRVGHDIRVQRINRKISLNFNPRAPGGARRCAHQRQFSGVTEFQSTCPGWGTTRFKCFMQFRLVTFQSTCPGWGTTRTAPATPPMTTYFNPRAPGGARHKIIKRYFPVGRISIHVPRVGHDAQAAGCHADSCYFNPRAPGGARPPTAGT